MIAVLITTSALLVTRAVMGRPSVAAPRAADKPLPGRWTFGVTPSRRTTSPILAEFRRDWGSSEQDHAGAWKSRMTALCALARLGDAALGVVLEGLDDKDDEVRQLCAQALAYFGDETALPRIDRAIREDPSVTVRVYATIARSAIAGPLPKTLIDEIRRGDPHPMVRYRLDLLRERTTPARRGAIRDELAAYDLKKLDSAELGKLAPDFRLRGLDGRTHQLSEFRGKKGVVLVFLYGANCMYCYGQVGQMSFHNKEFEAAGAEILMVESNEEYRVRSTLTMSGMSADRTNPSILVDDAQVVAATYGVAMQMEHIEWLNRPATFLIDKDGVLRRTILSPSLTDRPSPNFLLDELAPHA